MSENKKEKSSMATPEDLKDSEDFQEDLEKQKQKRLQQLAGANVPLFQKMDKMIELMEERNKIYKKLTEALTALVTISTSGTREGKSEVRATRTRTVKETRETQTPAGPEPPTPDRKQSLEEEGKKVEVGHTMEQPGVEAIKPIMPPQVTPSISTQIEQIKMMFPEDLENLLQFIDKEDHIKIKPRQFLGSDNFAKIASVVRAIGGEYVSAGKDSYFRVTKTQKKQTQQPLPQPAPDKPDQKGTTMLELAKGSFPSDLVGLLEFSEKDDSVIVKLRQFVGSDTFAKVARVIRELGGDYISAGKESHFKLPKKQE